MWYWWCADDALNQVLFFNIVHYRHHHRHHFQQHPTLCDCKGRPRIVLFWPRLVSQPLWNHHQFLCRSCLYQWWFYLNIIQRLLHVRLITEHRHIIRLERSEKGWYWKTRTSMAIVFSSYSTLESTLQSATFLLKGIWNWTSGGIPEKVLRKASKWPILVFFKISSKSLLK